MNQEKRRAWIKRHTGKALVMAAWLTAAGLAAVFYLTGEMRHVQAGSIQEGIAGEIIRFHVLANSDTQEDQELKLRVKDGLVDYLAPILSGASDVEETREILKARLGEIGEKAGELIREEGYAYEARAELTHCYFPIKTYGDCTFPAGVYEALRIRIGNAEGKNWWCVLYPNLCFIDSLHGILPEEQKQELQNVLTEEEYDSLLEEEPPKFQFWILDRIFGKTEK